MEQYDDQELLVKARLFDLDALARIYDLYNGSIYSYAYRLLGNPGLSEECVAETFSRFLNAIRAGLGPKDHLRAYLYRIAHNWLTDQFRRQEPLLFPVDLDLSLVAPNDTELEARDRIEIQKVRFALQKLTEEQQKVIILKFLEGWENEEVAIALDKPVGAVKSLQHRAINTLRRLLEKEVYENVSTY